MSRNRLAHVIALVAAAALAACAAPSGDGATSGGPDALADGPASTPAGSQAGIETGADDPGDVDPTAGEPELHGDGLLRGVPTTCTLVDDAPDGLIAASEQVQDQLGPDHGFGPLVAVTVDDTTTLVGASSFSGEAQDFAGWLVDADGTVRAIEGRASASTDFPAVTIATAGEGPDSRALAEAMDCSWIVAEAAGLRPEPEPVEAELRLDLVVATPNPASAGDLVDLSFPDETFRGVAFQLDRETGDGWEPIAWMTSSANGGDPMTVPVGSDGYGVDDVGIGGPGPDVVVLPDDLDPGPYRICTANRGDPEICAELTVE